MAPLILGLVLGDLLEKNFTRGLVLSNPFFTRPACAVLSALMICSIIWSIPAVNASMRNFLRRTLARVR